MKTIATLGPEYSQSWQAAILFDKEAQICLYPHVKALLAAFVAGETDYAILPVYNTREGEKKQYFRFFDQVRSGYWVDNVLLHSNLSLGVFDQDATVDDITMLVSKREVFNQCEEFIENQLPAVAEMSVLDVGKAIDERQRSGQTQGVAVIDNAETLTAHGLRIIEREVAPHNRTRYAVLGHSLAPVTGYDATTLITEPLDDRVGLLVDILNEFSRRGINIADMRTENDIKTQKLRIYLEAEGHSSSENMNAAIAHLESKVIGQEGMIRLLGSFPRVDMRTKYIKSFGFIGTGAMSKWFADRLENEGYEIKMTGRTSDRKSVV